MKYSEAKIENIPEVVKSALIKNKSTTKGMLLYGKTGSGKTYCLYAMKNVANKKYRIENWVEMMIEIRDRVSQGREIGAVIADICDTDVLAIDDLGAENQTPFSQEVIYAIINRFYIGEKRLIIATNLTLEDLSEKYGDRVFSRIAEMCELVEIKGNDRRLT